MQQWLYPVLRVGNMNRSISFYQLLGMTEQRRVDVPEGKYTMVWLGWTGDADRPTIGLTYNYDVPAYDHGTAFGQLVVRVEDVTALCASLRERGVKITREPGPVQFGTALIAFVEDPDGYRIELLQAA